MDEYDKFMMGIFGKIKDFGLKIWKTLIQG